MPNLRRNGRHMREGKPTGWAAVHAKAAKYKATDNTVFSQHTEKDKLDRRRCQTDLFFLARDVLGYNLMTEETHRQVVDFFVRKDPTKPLEEQSEIKRRLLLFPRGSFKSSLNIADAIQWILCFPDIRILILTAGSGKVESLSEAFVTELTQFFTWDRYLDPTRFQFLFPEFTIEPALVRPGQYTMPTRKKRWKEPTVMANTIDSTLSGWHFEVMKCDDVVSNRNSQTLDQLEKTTKNLHINRKMLRLGYYYDLVGTRYNEYDVYGDTLKKMQGEWSVLKKPAMWFRNNPDKRVSPDDIRYASPEEFELLFPSEIPYKRLMEEFRADEHAFFCQYQNDPISAGSIFITIDDMRKATLPLDMIPPLGEIHITWDLSYSDKKGRDFCAGIVARHHEGRIAIVDAMRGRYSPKELAFNIVSLSMRYSVKFTAIEDSLGARFLEPEIKRVAEAMGTDFYVEWIPVESSFDAKSKRYEAMQPLVMDGRMIFSAICPCLDQIYEEFINFNTTKYRDMADASARQLRYLPQHMKPAQASVIDIWEEVKAKELGDLMYARGRYAPKELLIQEPNPYALEDVLGGLIG